MGAKKRSAEQVYNDVVAAIHRADPADAVTQIRSYASEVKEECARVAESEDMYRVVCDQRGLVDVARAIRSIEIK